MAASGDPVERGGYASPSYAQSLAEFGAVRELPRSGGSLLVRAIDGGANLRDAMACYPLFSCRDWSELGADLDELRDALVSIALVTDPFADVTPAELERAFPDVCYEYKQHYVVDLTRPLESVIGSHHRRNVRKAGRAEEVRQEPASAELLATWQSLYSNLIARHGITGIARFSPGSFTMQMSAPGFAAFSAVAEGETCGVTLWYVDRGVAYYHLAAYSERGYEAGASFALFWEALSHFAKSGVRWAALGAGAGTNASDSGLTRFKQGWATGTRPVYFCGRVLQAEAYHRLSAGRDAADGFFPAYRAPQLKAAS
ncbi:MAG TPA: GNAT family N-acetyltransferase [Lacipirellula sp.]